ncbi:cysteine synthase family protein [Halodesulfovibrio sp.]|uniref:PLP-dependent cysteine synthase family protein n=1 Tax=Halodesulfovibrio sp. TaxID=1912772 RepID=UPI0025B9DA3F|nr:cysteine synthase family protein [Halodesulfovibrio sp.]
MSAVSIMDCIGHTPCLELNMQGGTVFAKAEFLNPGGSIKDRIIRHILDNAEQEGRLTHGTHIAEASSGNTGIALAMAGAAMGYKVTIFMPETASLERQKMIRHLGAEVVLTPAGESVGGAVDALHRLIAEEGDIFTVGQFVNKENIQAHYRTTARELWEDVSCNVDCFISGIGSGGTLMGVGLYLKEKQPNIHIAAVEPKGASALLGQANSLHRIEGIGDGFIPEILQPSIISNIIEIQDDVAMKYAADLAKSHGILAGISSGANLAAAAQIAKEHPEWRIATILPDRAERYFSTGLFGAI